MPARAWALCLGLIGALLVAVLGLDAEQTRQGESSLFGLPWGRAAPRAARLRRAPAPIEPGLARIAVVVDGFGVRQDLFDQVAAIGRPLTIAILADQPLSDRIARDAGRAGLEVLLEVPLEPYRYPEVNPGPGALLLSMGAAEVTRRVTRQLAALPSAAGVIGHLGSRFTEDQAHMEALLEPVRARGLVFVDGLVSNLSVGDTTARALGIPSVRRQVRVEWALGEGPARRHLDEVEPVAARRGEALVLVRGHPLTIRLLKEYIPEWVARGIQLVTVSRLAR